MAGKPVATIGSLHICPLCSGTVPHVGGPVTGPGMPGVIINGQPVAVMGDMCACAGPPDTIVQGCPGVTVNGKPIATVGCMTAHGGQIMIGVPGVTVGPAVPTPNATMPLKDIPFPKISTLDRVGAFVSGNASSLKKGEKAIQELKEEAAKVKQEASQEYHLTSQFAYDQTVKLAKQLSESNFMAIMVKIFGCDVPYEAYSQFYKDLSDEKVANVDIEVLQQSLYGNHAAYHTRKNVICISEALLQQAIDDNEKRAELLAALTEEFGHHIDYLLRNKYSSIKGDARNDEGAIFAFRVFDIDLLQQSSVTVGEVCSPEFTGTLLFDISAEHNDFKQFVNQQAQLEDGKSKDGTYEFFNAGLLDHGYGHENIDKKLEDIGYRPYEDLPHVYLGNWLRDYSQLICGATVRMTEEAQERLKKQKSPQQFAKIRELHSGKLSREGLTNIVGLLAAKEFVFDKQPGRWNEFNANECVKLFQEMFGSITPEMLGCYRPEEHIDNPKGLTDESYIDSDFFVGCLPAQLELNLQNGQKRHIKESFPERPSPLEYITNKLLTAAEKRRTPEGLRNLGAALHVLEDYFAHTNFVELCLIKLVNDKVYAWVEDIPETGLNPNDLEGNYLKRDSVKMLNQPFKSIKSTIHARASCIPVVSGVFGSLDTFATLCNKLRHLFELPNFTYVPAEPGQRSFSDLAIVAVLEDMAKGQKLDASKSNGNNKGTDYADLLDKYKYFLFLRDKKAQLIKDGGALGTTLKFLDMAGSTIAKLIAIPHTIALNALLYGMEILVKEAETYSRKFGTDPTHTQLNKDDPAHPINDLAGELAVVAAQKVGSQMLKCWISFDDPSKLIPIIKEIMSHPCHVDWMDEIVLQWAEQHRGKVRKLEKSSYLQIAQEQKQKLMASIDEERQYRDMAFLNMINYYENRYV